MAHVFLSGPLPGNATNWLQSKGVTLEIYEELPPAPSTDMLKSTFGKNMVALYGEAHLAKQLQLSNIIPISQETLATALASGSYDVIIPWLTTPITPEMISKAHPNLRALNTYSVGFDHLNFKVCQEAGIATSHTRNVLHFAVAEHTMALMLALTRRIAYQDWFFRKKLVRGKWHSNFFNYGKQGDLFQRTLGIVGFGQIGREVYKRAKSFGMRIIAYDPVFNHQENYPDVEFTTDLHHCLRASDIVTIHTPYFPEGHPHSTHKLIGKKELELIGNSGYLINTARGRIVDEEALATALDNHTIAGAALDVFYDEPHAKELLYHARENTVLAPHTASVGSSREDGQIEDFDALIADEHRLRTGFADGLIILGMASLTIINTYLILQGKEPLSLIPGTTWEAVIANRKKLNKPELTPLL